MFYPNIQFENLFLFLSLTSQEYFILYLMTKTHQWIVADLCFCCRITLNMERVAGLNVCDFGPTEVLRKYFRSALARIARCLVQLKRGTYIYEKTYAVLLKTKNMKV